MNESSSHNLAQRYLDDELSASERAMIATHLKRDAAADPLRRQIEAEHVLRDRVRAVMIAEHAAAPPALRERIASMISAERSGIAEATEAEPVKEGVGASDSDSSRSVVGRIFHEPTRANVYAVAASLLLVVGAVVFGIYAPRIDELRPFTAQTTPASEVASFVSTEHGKCARSEQTRREAIPYCSPGECCNALSKAVRRHVEIFDMRSEGLPLEFLGGGSVTIPKAGEAVRLMYAVEGDPAPRPMVSIFMFPYQPSDAPPPQGWQQLGSPPSCSRRVVAKYEKDMAYLVVCCDERMLEPITQVIDAHAQSR